MTAPIFGFAAQSVAVTSLIGAPPQMRFYSFGRAPKTKQAAFSAAPYAIHQWVYGSPTNYMGDLPDSDNGGFQVDAYAKTDSEARQLGLALRDAFEPHGYVVAYNGEDMDDPTGLYRFSFTVEFWTDRGS